MAGIDWRLWNLPPLPACCRLCAYETARRSNPTRWSRSTRCWRQPEEMWINKPTEEPDPILALALIQIA